MIGYVYTSSLSYVRLYFAVVSEYSQHTYVREYARGMGCNVGKRSTCVHIQKSVLDFLSKQEKHLLLSSWRTVLQQHPEIMEHVFASILNGSDEIRECFMLHFPLHRVEGIFEEGTNFFLRKEDVIIREQGKNLCSYLERLVQASSQNCR